MCEVILHKTVTKLTVQKLDLGGNSCTPKQRQEAGSNYWSAKLDYTLNTDQYVGGVPFDHSQEQVLVKPMSLPGNGITRHINKFLCKAQSVLVGFVADCAK